MYLGTYTMFEFFLNSKLNSMTQFVEILTSKSNINPL